VKSSKVISTIDVKDLVVGKKYKVYFDYGDIIAFYDGKCDSFNGQKCSCCNKDLERGYLFKIPSNDEITYKECSDGKYIEYIPIGSSCIKKINIERV
jgi:hypothetical protein